MASWKQIVELYRLTMPEEPPENFKGESYNVAPTDVMPIVRPAGNGRELVFSSTQNTAACAGGLR